MCRRVNRTSAGHSLTFVALIMPLMLGLLLASLELVNRSRSERALTGAFTDAIRSVAQTVDYGAFAEDRVMLEEDEAALVKRAQDIFVARLHEMEDMALDPAATGAAVAWTIVRDGGTCTLSDGTTVSFSGPAICATVVVPLRGLIWPGTRMVPIDAASTLDSSEEGE